MANAQGNVGFYKTYCCVHGQRSWWWSCPVSTPTIHHGVYSFLSQAIFSLVTTHLLDDWEDNYDPTDPKFPCKVDRTAGTLKPSQQLNVINQNLNFNVIPVGRGLRIPDRMDGPRTNSVYPYVEVWRFICITRMMKHSFRIEARANHCASLAGDQYFVLVDFVNIGQVATTITHLNGFPTLTPSNAILFFFFSSWYL